MALRIFLRQISIFVSFFVFGFCLLQSNAQLVSFQQLLLLWYLVENRPLLRCDLPHYYLAYSLDRQTSIWAQLRHAVHSRASHVPSDLIRKSWVGNSGEALAMRTQKIYFALYSKLVNCHRLAYFIRFSFTLYEHTLKVISFLWFVKRSLAKILFNIIPPFQMGEGSNCWKDSQL